MTDFKVGDICKCRDHYLCFFTPGSIVVITRVGVYENQQCVAAKLLFGDYKPNYDTDLLLAQSSTENGAVYCLTMELEPFNEQPSNMEKES